MITFAANLTEAGLFFFVFMVIRKVFLFVFCLFIFYAGTAQKVELKGRVTERLTGEPLKSALIRVIEPSVTAISDANGYYSLLLDRNRVYTINVTYVGFKQENRKIELKQNQTVNFLMENDFHLDEVIVTATAPDERIKMLTMGVESMTALEIKQMPALMGEVDVLKAIQLLPGVQATSEGGSGYSVRGGSPDQNFILIDNTTVYNASHLLGFFSIFNNDVISGLDLYKGDIPLRYGGRLASLLDVRTKDNRPDKFNGVGGIGLISSRLTMEGPIGEKTSWLAGGRRSYADLFLKLSANESLRRSAVYFYDLNGKLTHRFSTKDILEFNGYIGDDIFNADMGKFYYGNGAASLTWRRFYSDESSSRISFNLSNYKYGLESKLENAKATWTSNITDYMLRFDMNHSISDLWKMTYGLTSTFHHFQPGIASMGSASYKVDGTNALEHGIYFSNEQKFSEIFSMKYGVRFSVFQNIGEATVFTYDDEHRAKDSTTYKSGQIFNTYTAFEPRAGFVIKTGETSSIKGNYVHNVQFMQLANNSASGSPLDIWFPASPNIKPQSVDMFSAGFFHNFNDNMYESSVELYYKHHHNVIDFAEHASLILNKHLENEVRTGKGKAYGAEFMVRKNKGDLTGFVNYTLSRSERTIPEVNKGKTYLSPYDKTHSFNLVANYEFSKKLTVSAIWVYATGNPTTYPSGRFEINGEFFPIYSGRNEYRRPDYHRLDLSLTFLPRPESKKRLRGEWNLSVYNAYGKKNPWMITYNQNDETGLPYAQMLYLFGIVPSISYNFKF